ncbi:MAG: MarR family winged helix-turn-helix transcriptional regulator [Chloroflexota bacterium]
MIDTSYDLLKDVYLLLDDGDRFFLKQYGITPAQYYALLWLDVDEPKNLSQLSKDMLTDPGNVTRLTDRMDERGWVLRQRDQVDRRVIWVSLTPQGRQLCSKVRQAHADYVQVRMNLLTTEEQNQLQTLLHKLRDGLSKKP